MVIQEQSIECRLWIDKDCVQVVEHAVVNLPAIDPSVVVVMQGGTVPIGTFLGHMFNGAHATQLVEPRINRAFFA